MKIILAFFSLVVLSGCASIMAGTTQDIAIDSTPSGANCTAVRGQENLASFTTPHLFHVQKTREDIVLSCTQSGYAPTTMTLISHTDAYAIGNGGFGTLAPVTWGIDAARGADNKYDERVTVVLKK